MPPLKGIDRGLNGTILKALEESGHGRRIAVVDASYNIPRWAQVVDYAGATSVDALIGILRLVPYEGTISLMRPDETTNPNDWVFGDLATIALEQEFDEPDVVRRLDTIYEGSETAPGFYTIANNPDEDTLFVRTRDTLAYACATFIVGHSQE